MVKTLYGCQTMIAFAKKPEIPPLPTIHIVKGAALVSPDPWQRQS